MSATTTVMNDAAAPWEGPLQILSLDGGGLKGLFGAALLAGLEKDFGTSMAEHFDLIVGTSTGGLVALGMGAGLPLSDMVGFYEQLGPKVFKGGPVRNLTKLVRPMHPGQPLRDALEQIFEQRTLGQSEKRLVIPSYSLDDNEVYLFKTPHHSRLTRDGRERMVDVALATSAAPTYLPAARLRNQRLIDGGVWANNPTFVGVAEAISMLGARLDQVRVLSIGTTDPVTDLPDSLMCGGVLQWAKHAPQLILRAQSLGTLHAAEHLLGQAGRLTRINCPVPEGLFDLDKLSPSRIQGLAETVGRKCSPQVRPFTEHVASRYVPSGRVN